MTEIARLRLMEGKEKLSRSDCETGTPVGVIDPTTAKSRTAASTRMIKLTLP